MKKSIRYLYLLALVLFSTSCAKQNIKIENIALSQQEQFGSVNFEIPNEQVFKNGINFGDSVNIEFDNGVHYEDIPYYDGIYAKTNDIILLSHSSEKIPSLFFVNGPSLWEKSNLSTDNKGTIILNESGKYKNIQDSLSLDYSKNREDFDSDEIFANFRAIKGGKLKDNLIYRGVSPIDNAQNRAKYAAKLVEENKLDYIMNLSDNEKKYYKFIENGTVTDYFTDKFNSGKMPLLSLGSNFDSNKNRKAVAKTFKDFTEKGGKVYIHCLEGKDRTGFVGALVLALADASSEEIEKDYMLTYKNYNNITKESDKKRYDAISKLKLPEFYKIILDDKSIKDYSNISFQNGAKKYLMSGGLSEDEVNKVVDFLTK